MASSCVFVMTDTFLFAVRILASPFWSWNMQPTGVRIEDMGHKMGCNGVDNGKLWFDNVRVPREALLNAFSGMYTIQAWNPLELHFLDVSPKGQFSSRVVKKRDRFLKVAG